jgi:two-component system, OmpR family, response regulator MprA
MHARILVVEDDRFIREVVAIALRAEGYEVDLAEDGDRGWRYLAERSPSLVILDLALPYVDGLTICRRLRATPRQTHIPVLVVSAVPNDGAARVALDAGADAFLHKPFDLAELVELVRRLIGPPEDSADASARASVPVDGVTRWRAASEAARRLDKDA